ncbi:MAG: TlpA family protein disulfide reductase [Acidobacteria bacterium]|nr:TlpA family protein disulfide reductase [Acidobacteriota bacterium]
MSAFPDLSRRATVFLLAVALLSVSCDGRAARPAGASGPPRCRPAGLLQVGDLIPDCAFRTFEGKTLRLADLLGHPAVINFWASWCSQCIREMPAFQRVHERVAGRVAIVGMDLLGVDGETESAAQDFARRTGARYRLAYDRDGLLYAGFSPRVLLPTTIFAKADGTIVLRRFGPLDEPELLRVLSDTFGVSTR